MPRSPSANVQNNFTGGLKTEFTGLNFPENAATDCDNVVFELVGDVTRRLGINYEDNFELQTVNRTDLAISSYVWTNVGGDGSTKMLVKQIGSTLYFYDISTSTEADPLSTRQIASTVDMSTFIVPNPGNDPSSVECEYASGKGYLFVYNPYCDTFYVSWSDPDMQASVIDIQTRDFTGYDDSLSVSVRPSTISPEHRYNLQNQGWTSGNSWTLTSSSTSYAGLQGPNVNALGSYSWVVQASVAGVTIGQTVVCSWGGDPRYWPYQQMFRGVITAYSGTTLTLNVNQIYHSGARVPGAWLFSRNAVNTTATFVPVGTGYVDTFFSSQAVYPSNSDVWWRFKDSTDVFNPNVTVPNVTLNTGAAPKGHYIYSEFNQTRSSISGLSVNNTSTMLRPRTGAWFAGRVWYTGVDDTYHPDPSSSDASPYNWNENIYFSQTVQTVNDFGSCYQVNDPTAEDLFDLLPTDGGVLTIQGCGNIYKLFPIQNGMLVFCQNGIWFITGSQGIGFAANDYTITKISAVQSISSTSYVDVNGLPFFWNEEGIYTITPAQQGLGLSVTPLTIDTILSFYQDIPTASKQYVRGDYDPINYIITWTYRSTVETSATNRYEFDKCLNFNTSIKAFYPYSIKGAPFVHGVKYISYPNAATSPDPTFKYICSVANAGSYDFTFAEENDVSYLDFAATGTGANYQSYFVTGYRLAGQGQRKFQTGYVYMFSKNETDTAYRIQSRWDYATSGDSGRWSSLQLININQPNYGMAYRRHKLRGQGIVGQIYVQSVDGEPFDIMGWSIWETQNTGV